MKTNKDTRTRRVKIKVYLAEKHVQNTIDVTQSTTEFICEVERCGKICKKKEGLAIHKEERIRCCKRQQK